MCFAAGSAVNCNSEQWPPVDVEADSDDEPERAHTPAASTVPSLVRISTIYTLC